MSTLSTALQNLADGKSIIYPTDTVYGIGCDASNEQAVQYIFDITDRPSVKWLIILCDSVEMIEQYAEIHFETERKIIENGMPWPLTLVLDSKHELPLLLEQANGTIGVRIPDHDLALDIISWFWKPLATKSANRAGLLPPTNADEIDPYFAEQWIEILDDGEVDIQVPSTIVRVIDEGQFQILREWSITEDDIRELID